MRQEYYLSTLIKAVMIFAVVMEALKAKLEDTKAKLEAEDFTNITKDDIIGDLLYTTALGYFAELDTMNYMQSKTMGVVAVRLPSESIFSLELSVSKLFGIPKSVEAGGLAMDVARDLSIVKPLDGDNDKKVQFVLASGQNSSALEHSVPEQMFSTEEEPAYGISAVKALKIANDQGIPIYTINQTNIDTIIPQLQVDAGTIADIQNAVNAGMFVTVPKTDITFNGWTGVGYIIFDINTGAGAYMISGGTNGAIIIFEIVINMLLSLLVTNAEAAEPYKDAYTYISENGCGYFHPDDYYGCIDLIFSAYFADFLIGFIALIAAATVGGPIGWAFAITIAVGMSAFALYARRTCIALATYCE